ncbi:hypothetical protein, partial [Paraburkholderia sp. GAS32]|uniref:hypothetical protein n=1 Tax=Paraburkholderia sp. GAS32 TaxID=3035129 RepID=UPI003D1FB6B1
DSADSRVKVGNRQAPLQDQKPHPEKVGFLRLRGKNQPSENIATVRPCPVRLLSCRYHSFPIRSAVA